MDNGYSLSDLAAATNGGMFGGSNEFIWIFALLILFGGGGFGFNRNAEQAVANNEILSGQRFDMLSRQINQVGDGIASLGYSQLQQMDANTASINGNVTNEGRNLQMQIANCCCDNQKNIDTLRYEMANMIAGVNANTTAQAQAIKDTIAQNKIEALQQKVASLELAQATGNVVRYPSATTYCSGANPFCGCGCGCAN